MHPRLFALAAVITADPATADDALAGAYAAAWSRFRQGGVADLERYLWRSVARAARRAGRLHRRPPPAMSPPAPRDPAEMVADLDFLTFLLGRLPVEQRMVVSLRYLADFSEADVARLLGTSPGTVKSRLARAAAALRAEVRDSQARAQLGSGRTRGGDDA